LLITYRLLLLVIGRIAEKAAVSAAVFRDEDSFFTIRLLALRGVTGFQRQLFGSHGESAGSYDVVIGKNGEIDGLRPETWRGAFFHNKLARVTGSHGVSTVVSEESRGVIGVI
jgi:hypothetical protein